MTHPAYQAKHSATRLLATFALASASCLATPAFAQTPYFATGNLVVVVEGCGVNGGTCTNIPNGNGTGAGNSSATGYGDNQAAPLTLFQFTPIGTTSATYVNALVLPQAASGANLPVSGEYGSSSEGTLQLSGSGQYLTVAAYGINAAIFDANPTAYGAAPSLALAQSGSLTGQTYTPIPRVIALIDKNANVNSTSALYNIFNLNNPRSVYTFNGQNAYISGQGSGSDATGGVFLTPLGAPNTAPTAITGLDTTNNTIAQDTREVQFYNNTLYVSVDSKAGSGSARDFIGTLGTPGSAPTALTGPPVMLSGFGNSGGTGKVSITAGALGTTNGNGMNAGQQINISPNNFFFANPATLYVADGGAPKNNSATSPTGNGGLEKWINSQPDGTGTWSLAYTLAQGLGLVANTTGTGTSGLYGLAGSVSGNTVQLFATNYTLNDLDPTYLFGITDNLIYTTPAQAVTETFAKLASAPSDSNFKGVAFAPTIATPIITWNPPAAITFGSALSDVQLNATTTVPGTFIYTPALGTVLPVGASQTLSVSFYPTDVINYAETTATTTITINPATPTTAANLVTTRVITRSGGNLLVQITVANTGQTAASGVILTSAKIGSTSATYLPLYFGSIAPGASSTVTATVPGSAGASGAASSVTITGVYSINTGASFSSSARVTLP